MKNPVYYRGYTIYRHVVAVSNCSGHVIAEYNSMAEARHDSKDGDVYFEYTAAEVISERGDLAPACYGRSLKEAMSKLKELLV